MPDTPENGNADEATSDATAANDAAGDVTQQTSGENGVSGGTDDEALKRKAEQAVAEAIAERKKRQALEEKVKEYELANASDLEKAQAAAEAANAKATTASNKAKSLAISLEAAAMKFVNPKTAARLIDTDALDPDSDTFEADVKAALEALATAEPYLIQAAAASTTSPGNGDKGGTKKLTQEDLRGMTRAELEALTPEERRAAMANG